MPGETPTNELGRAPVALFDSHWAPVLTFAASLGRRGVPLHVYGRGAGRWSRYCSERRSCPPVEDADRFVPWLEQRVRSGEIGRVAPTTDLIAYYTAQLREAFAPEVRRTIPPLAQIEHCLIKSRFAAACNAVGQGTPDTAEPTDRSAALLEATRLGYPLIVKPKSHLVVGPDERGALVRNPEELRWAFRRYPVLPGQESLARRYPSLLWPMLQRYVPSARTRVYSVSGFKDADGGIVAASLSVKRRQWPPDRGISVRQVTANDPSILADGLRTVDRLLAGGMFELELLASPAGLLAIDLNPRAFGFMALDLAIGDDLPWLWYRATQGALPAVPIPASRPLVEARLTIPSIVGGLIYRLVCRPPRGALGSVRPGKSLPRVSMLGHWSDPLPKLLAHWNMLRHPGGIVRPFVQAAANLRRNRRARRQQLRAPDGRGKPVSVRAESESSPRIAASASARRS